MTDQPTTTASRTARETDDTPATCRDPIRHRTTLRVPGDLLSPYDDAVERGDYASLSAALRAGLAAGAPALGSEDDQPADPAAARSSGKQAESTEEMADE
jgi:Arc/MetJ-type ribon-helix-helix transcriptional regulator